MPDFFGNHLRVLATFARNSLVRDMTFRGNFLIEAVTSLGWALMNLAFYVLIFSYTSTIGDDAGWSRDQFFLFIATALIINSIVQTFFMTNADELSDLIRLGSLDFILLKPMDTQFLVSLRRIDWSSLVNLAVGVALGVYAMVQLRYVPGPVESLLYPLYLVCGVAVYYSLMIAMAATTVWLGRNVTLLDFWFYLTTFSRYPMEIYQGRFGTPLRRFFTFIIPVLVVVNVPARILVRSLRPETRGDWLLAAYTLLATAASLVLSRWVFQRSLESYRSASS
ncbi:MAG: ABC-2 family transporter protein [Thermoguttaceae bacterium]|jgi:ABC-2 type transport system permease protein